MMVLTIASSAVCAFSSWKKCIPQGDQHPALLLREIGRWGVHGLRASVTSGTMARCLRPLALSREHLSKLGDDEIVGVIAIRALDGFEGNRPKELRCLGKPQGYRTIIAFRSGDWSVFMYGFATNSKANLSEDELAVYRRLATVFLEADAAMVQRLIAVGELKEVECDGQEEA